MRHRLHEALTGLIDYFNKRLDALLPRSKGDAISPTQESDPYIESLVKSLQTQKRV